MQEFGSGAASGVPVIALVKWYDAVKGFGFLTPADGSRDVFCHASVVGRAGWDTLPEGATVTCEVEQGRQGPQLWRIHGVDPPAASSPGAAGSGSWLDQGRGTASGDRAPSPGRRLVASVTWFVSARGFGFLTPDDGSPDVFCHVSVVEEAGYGTLPQGALVTCEVEDGRRGPVVSSILAVDASNAPTGRAGHDEPRRSPQYRGRDRDDPAGLADERHGLVKFYNAAKGYGFVVPDDGGPDVFLHGSVLNRAGLGVPEPGQRVSVMVAQGARGPQAADIALL